ncbi:helix-turn-helix domain-containing protein [Sporosarcina soli]|uniref:Helix-turn-helix domain-containing protein n=2 Tax=Sporosarcina TaxID=1569 RepID=A0ABW0TRB0_9BACL
MSQNQVSTLKRGLLVLEFIKQSRGITLAEVMKEFQLSKSTAF